MGFFDKMGETISTKSKDVAKKAKEMAEVTSLNSKISTQKDIINKIHKEIGEMVCADRENWTGLNLDDQFARLDAAAAEIERLQAEIQRVKGIKLCANCGAEMERTVAFCPSCGTPAPIVEDPEPETAETTENADVVVEAEVVEAEVVEATEEQAPTETV